MRPAARPGGLSPAAPTKRTALRRSGARSLRGIGIGYVLDRFPRGSHDFVVLQEIHELETRGVEAHVLALGAPEGRLDDMAFALARLKNPVYHFWADDIGRQQDDGPAAEVAWLASRVAVCRIEHLHAHGTAESIEVTRRAARLAGVGYSFTTHSRTLNGNGADRSSLAQSVGDASFVVTPTDYERMHLLQTCGPYVAQKLHRIPMGLNPDEWNFSRTDSDATDSILAVGPPTEQSGFADVIEAVRILRERGRVAHLTIAREGDDADLRTRIEAAGLGTRVRLTGALSQPELAMLMREHTLLVLPTVADHCYSDDLATTALVAMSVGLIVLCPDLPGIREFIEDGLTGRVITPKDSSWLAGAIETLFSSRELRDRMANRARRKVEQQFAASHNVPQLARLFVESRARADLAG